MKVYIVTHGIICEGGDIVGVYPTRKAAEKAVASRIEQSDLGEWRRCENCVARWEASGWFIDVQEHVVQDAP